MIPVIWAFLLAAATTSPPQSTGPSPDAAAPKTVQRTELSTTFDVYAPNGEVDMAVAQKITMYASSLGSMREITVKTPKGTFHIDVTIAPPGDASRDPITGRMSREDGASIQYTSGSLEPYVKELGGPIGQVLKHQVVAVGGQQLEFSELSDADLLAGKISAKELARFRAAVPEDLSEFAQLVVETADLTQLSEHPIIMHMAKLAAPKGTKTDARARGWYTSEKRYSKRVTEIPVLTGPPPSPPEGVKVKKTQIR